MIDWYSLATNSVWILACALALAVMSHASWQGSVNGRKFFEQMREPGYVRLLLAAGLLFCVGLGGAAEVWWERGLWLLLGVFFVIQMVFSLKRS